jgi:hypothetical protein
MAAATPPANARRRCAITDNARPPPESEPSTPLPNITHSPDGSLARKLAENYSVPFVNAMSFAPPGAHFYDYC